MAPSTSPLIVGIAGGSGSGKTTLADRIVEGLPVAAATVIRHDHYSRPHSWSNTCNSSRWAGAYFSLSTTSLGTDAAKKAWNST
jgi:uridine kinase